MNNKVKTIETMELTKIPAEVAMAMAEEMEGLGTPDFDRVKIPAGGGLAFELPGEDEDNPETATEIVGCIVHRHAINAYWQDAYNGANEPPTCASMDGVTGMDTVTGECKECRTCPKNQFGSADDGRGKACKNGQRLYILRDGDVFPILLSLPPTSIRPLRNYIAKRLLAKGLMPSKVMTRIALKKEKSAAGITYSLATFAMAGVLSEDAQKTAAAAGDMVKALAGRVDLTGDFQSVEAEGFDE